MVQAEIRISPLRSAVTGLTHEATSVMRYTECGVSIDSGVESGRPTVADLHVQNGIGQFCVRQEHLGSTMSLTLPNCRVVTHGYEGCKRERSGAG